ncbi:Ubiquitin-related modifier 1 -like protein [Toxocara canis]|uniref:Ubiquitin-related modifier 1 homolog n=1 Tax=Toxocara canis TaxID=6265 RepID=A0A0B2VR84_TOXCA|nr:Ubiquitin-related modifier 1 -like protein [Toxocara canis]
MGVRQLKLEFCGGAEALFGQKRTHEVSVPANDSFLLSDLLCFIKENLIEDKERTNLLIERDTVRPGILVLVNDVDWELLGGLNAPVYLQRDRGELLLKSSVDGKVMISRELIHPDLTIPEMSIYENRVDDPIYKLTFNVIPLEMSNTFRLSALI